MCSLFSQQGRENLNLLPLQCQITSQQRLNIMLKKPNITVIQIDGLPSLRIATAVSGEVRQNYLKKKRAKSWVKPKVSCGTVQLVIRWHLRRPGAPLKLNCDFTSQTWFSAHASSLFGEECRPNTRERRHSSLYKTWLWYQVLNSVYNDPLKSNYSKLLNLL